MLREVRDLDAVAEAVPAGDDLLEKRRLPAAVGADEGDVLASLECQRDVVQELLVACLDLRMLDL